MRGMYFLLLLYSSWYRCHLRCGIGVACIRRQQQLESLGQQTSSKGLALCWSSNLRTSSQSTAFSTKRQDFSSTCMAAPGGILAQAPKRKRSSDAVSECTHTTECTDVSNAVIDERAQALADKRAQHAAQKLELEQQLQQLDEQRAHVALQLEQLEGCDGEKDQLGISDLKQQLQSYEEQRQAAVVRLADLQQQFEAAVAGILGLTPGQQPHLLAAAMQEQQQLQEAQVQQLVVEQQLAGSDFAVTSSRPHKSKQARMDKMSSVWDWLQGSGGGGASGAGAVASSSREQQQGQAAAAAAAAQGDDKQQDHCQQQLQQQQDDIGQEQKHPALGGVLEQQQQQVAGPPQAVQPVADGPEQGQQQQPQQQQGQQQLREAAVMEAAA